MKIDNINAEGKKGIIAKITRYIKDFFNKYTPKKEEFKENPVQAIFKIGVLILGILGASYIAYTLFIILKIILIVGVSLGVIFFILMGLGGGSSKSSSSSFSSTSTDDDYYKSQDNYHEEHGNYY